MSGWIIAQRGSYYGPFATLSQAVAWAERKLGNYPGAGWLAAELYNPKNVD